MNNQTLALAFHFLRLRRKGHAAKHAAQAVAIAHGVTETRVLCAYELYELEAAR